MPTRNLVLLITLLAFSAICYLKAPGNYYATQVAEAMELISRASLEPVELRELFENAMQGMLTGFDPHSRYLPPAEYRPLQEDLDQQFGGVGIIVEQNVETGALTVLRPSLGSPAERAGIRAGDVIVAIDGHPAEGIQMSEAVQRIRGRPGTRVRLTVRHVGSDEPVDYELERQIIAVPSVLGDVRDERGGWQFVLADHPRIGYIRIETFGEQTVSELRAALESIAGRVDGLVLDLRNNSGGLLSAAVETCDLFLASGEIVSIRVRGGAVRDRYEARPGVAFPLHIPMAVLVNQYSASASEIVAACLQDHGRAVVVGQRTWGKGTVQNIYPFEGGRSALKLTVAEYRRPSGTNIHRGEGVDEQQQWGVKPNPGLDVPLEEDEFVQLFRQRRERDLPSAAATDNAAATPIADRQLQRALEYLTRQTAGAERSQ